MLVLKIWSNDSSFCYMTSVRTVIVLLVVATGYENRLKSASARSVLGNWMPDMAMVVKYSSSGLHMS